MTRLSLMRLYLLALAFAMACLVVVPPAHAQEHEAGDADHGEEAEETEYRHIVTGFFGGITRTERGDSGLAVGLSYAYGVFRQWAIGVKFEGASGSIERDWLLLFGVAFEPVERLEFSFALGPERVKKLVLEEGEPVTEFETEPLVRFTVGWAAWRINERLSLGPEFNIDVGSQVSLVYGLALSVGL